MRVRFPFYYPYLLGFVVLLQIGSMFIKGNINMGTVTHGRVNRCNFDVDCVPSQRSAFDTTWLCCEQDTFWPASHIITPMLVMFFLGSFFATALFVYKWEALEAISLTYFGSFVIYPTTLNQLETTAGSLIADAAIQGMLGLLLGSLIASYSGYPGLLPLILQDENGLLVCTGFRMRTRGIAWKHFFVCLLAILPFLFAGNATPDGKIVWGSYLALGGLFFILTVVFPNMIYADDAIGVDMAATYRRAAPLLVICMLVIGLSSVGFHFLANDFFQSWMLYFVATLIVILWTRFASERTPAIISAQRP